jgi:hypothetical protein
MKGADADLYLDRQAMNTTTPAGKALFQMLGVFAEFERSIIQERIAAGIAQGARRAPGVASLSAGQGSPRPRKRPSGRRWRAARAF